MTKESKKNDNEEIIELNKEASKKVSNKGKSKNESDTKESSDKKSSTTKNMHNKNLGKKGEDAAATFLKNKNYMILEKNWKCKFGEADIIAKNEDALVFVEVKTRSNINTGLPEDAVGAKKRKKYECIAAKYLQEHDYVDIPIRFDVVAILVIDSNRALIRHHVNAFGVA